MNVSVNIARFPTALVLAGGVLLLSACVDSRGGTIPYNRVFGQADEQTYVTLPTDYKIAPMDMLSVKVFRSPDLTGDYGVDLAGNIALPLIGSVSAANRTTEELQQSLVMKLEAKYLENPDVSVAIKESTAHSVTVDGAVSQPGAFPVGNNTSLIQTIALARGTTEDANPRRVAIFRTIGGQRQAAAFDLTAIRRGEAPDPTIYPGDIVVVDGSRVKVLQRQLLQTIPLLNLFRPLVL